MIFNTFWTILLGVIGGIVSSLIVSRVFLIQGEFQEQVRYMNTVLRKLEYINGYLLAIKGIFEMKHDFGIHMQKEMKEKGYHSEKEYYDEHANEEWVPIKDLLEIARKEIKAQISSIESILENNQVEDAHFSELEKDIVNYLEEVSSFKEYTFHAINSLINKEQNLVKKYDAYLQMSGKKLTKLVIKDKIMTIVFIILSLLIIGTIISYILGV